MITYFRCILPESYEKFDLPLMYRGVLSFIEFRQSQNDSFCVGKICFYKFAISVRYLFISNAIQDQLVLHDEFFLVTCFAMALQDKLQVGCNVSHALFANYLTSY